MTSAVADTNFASICESVADALPGRDALVQGACRRSWHETEDRAARLAEALRAFGLTPGSTVACYLHNCPEYIETLLAAFKLRCLPVNINYRYEAGELAYLLDDSDAEALVFDEDLAERVAAARDRAPRLRALIQVGGEAPLVPDAVQMEQMLRASAPMERIPRSGDDRLLLYTGGTTGLPKGVVWTCADLLLGPGTRRTFLTMEMAVPATAADFGRSARSIAAQGLSPVTLPASPLMHGAGFGQALGTMLLGGTVVMLQSRSFDAHELWRTVERERVTQIGIVGDPFARPMIEALEEAEARGKPYDIASVKRIVSTGAMWSAGVKGALLVRGEMVLQDNLASSEAQLIGSSLTERGNQTRTAEFQVGDYATVLAEDGRPIEPGSDEVGLLAVSWPIPLGYHKDPEKTARTFRSIGGRRYAIPGDWARVDADGRIMLVGRGSVCINTAGEKVFPEEVEEAVKEYPGVVDCVVVGVPDERRGETVVAVLSVRQGCVLDPARFHETACSHLARFKRPRHLVVVNEVYRSPSGKADYAWARDVAMSAPRP